MGADGKYPGRRLPQRLHIPKTSQQGLRLSGGERMHGSSTTLTHHMIRPSPNEQVENFTQDELEGLSVIYETTDTGGRVYRGSIFVRCWIGAFG